jgi:hypothetical protein
MSAGYKRDVWWAYRVQRSTDGRRWRTVARAVSEREAFKRSWAVDAKHRRVVALDGEVVGCSVRCYPP